jgi:Zn-dependent metalloprotease
MSVFNYTHFKKGGIKMLKFSHIVIYVLISHISIQASDSNNKISNKFKKMNFKTEKMLIHSNGKISERSGVFRYLYNENFRDGTSTPREIAINYLKKYHTKFGIDNNLNTIKITNIKKSKGGSHIHYKQYVNGIPVFGTNSSITINNSNTVKFIANNYRPNIVINITSPEITEQNSIEIARRYLNVKGKIIGEESAELMIFESTDIGAELAWSVSIVTLIFNLY